MSLLQNSVEPCYLPFSWWVNCCFHNSFITGFGKLKKPQKRGRKDGFPPQATTLASSGKLLTWARLSVFVTKRGHFTHISNVWGLDKIFSFLMEQPLWGSHCELGPMPSFQHGSRSLYSLLPVYLPAVLGGESRPLRVLPIRPLVLRQNPSLPIAAHMLDLGGHRQHVAPRIYHEVRKLIFHMHGCDLCLWQDLKSRGAVVPGLYLWMWSPGSEL